MRETKPLDYFLLTLLALIWAAAFFNIKIATYSYGPLTIAFLRIFFGGAARIYPRIGVMTAFPGKLKAVMVKPFTKSKLNNFFNLN